MFLPAPPKPLPASANQSPLIGHRYLKIIHSTTWHEMAFVQFHVRIDENGAAGKLTQLELNIRKP